MKNSFKSRGYTYHVCDAVEFGDLYYGEEEAQAMTTEYLTDCLNALCVGFVQRGEDDFYVYVSPTTDKNTILQEVMYHYLELWGDDLYCQAMNACVIITENLDVLRRRTSQPKAQLI